MSAAGLTPLPDKVKAIADFPQPTNLKALQEFLGMLNYYHRFLPHVAETLIPLHDALRGRKNNQPVKWDNAMVRAFKRAKRALANATLLVHPVDGAPTALTVDASQYAVGGVLEQLVNGIWRPLGFFSKRLRDPREVKYPAFDRELLGAHLATRHFRWFIEGRPFALYTDQNSLVPSMVKTTEPHNARRANQLAAISEFTTNIKPIEGKKNVVADALSRAPVAEDDDTDAFDADSPPIFAIEINSIDYQAMARAQAVDDVQRLRGDDTSGLKLQHFDVGEERLLCDTSTG
ncbi:MAG: ribonuclease H family protein, partial [Bacteroidota bacterium]|nr:ribonuclease H family protein [Bacteroidota bacterium]